MKWSDFDSPDFYISINLNDILYEVSIVHQESASSFL